MQFRKIEPSDQRQVQAFLDLPFRLYRDDPLWVPPLAGAERLALDPERHPFYRHSQAAFFVVDDGPRTVGRIVVADNRPYNRFHDSATGFFYDLDLEDDPEILRRLLEAAGNWAADRGLGVLMGPKGLLRTDAVGMLVEGFEHLPLPNAPYNPPSYPRLLEAVGFTKEIDYLSGYLLRGYRLPDRYESVADRAAARYGLTVRGFTSRRQLRQWVPQLLEINNAAFQQVWGFYPIEAAEAEMIGAQITQVADPRLIKLILHDGRAVGFLFAFPDVSAALRRTRGRTRAPWDALRIYLEARRTPRINILGVGLLPEYQRRGAGAILYREMYRTVVQERSYRMAEVGQVPETNRSSLNVLKSIGVELYKKQRVYRIGL